MSSMQKISHTPGLCGLPNLGNNDFINSVLQCLSNVPQLTEYFLRDEYKRDINRNNPLGMRGAVAETYGDLMHNMWSDHMESYAPRSLKHHMARYTPQFSENASYDAQEFMSFLLDGLHEDLNLVRQKLYVEKKDDDGQLNDAALAQEQWEYYCKRNQSIIQDIFYGQVKTTIQCLTCHTKARTFDPICFLGLPLSEKNKIRTFKIDYVRLNGQINTYSMKFDESKRMSDLVSEFCERFQPKTITTSKIASVPIDGASASNEFTSNDNKQPEGDEEVNELEKREDFTKEADYDGHQPRRDFILPVEVYNHRIHLQYSDNSSLSSILDRDQIAFYEVADSLKKGSNDTILMPCVFRSEYNRQNFGYPIYLTIPRTDCRGKDILEALKKSIGNYIPLSSHEASGEPQYTGLLLTNQNYYSQTRTLESILNEHIRFGSITTILIVEVAPSVVEGYEKRQENNQFALNSTTKNPISSDNEQKQKTIALMDSFKQFTRREIPSNTDDVWICPRCKENRQTSRKIDLWLLPKVLIVQLKRFNYTRYFRDKIDLLIDYPLHDLDLSEFVLNPAQKANAKYDLIAVLNHSGGLGGGHYTAHAKNRQDQKWYTFDDSYVCETREDTVISKAGYVLIYQRKDQPTSQ